MPNNGTVQTTQGVPSIPSRSSQEFLRVILRQKSSIYKAPSRIGPSWPAKLSEQATLSMTSNPNKPNVLLTRVANVTSSHATTSPWGQSAAENSMPYMKYTTV